MKGGEDLAGLGWVAEASAWAAHSAGTAASATGAARAVATIHLGVQFRCQCHQLLLGHDAAGVGVGLIEEGEGGRR